MFIVKIIVRVLLVLLASFWTAISTLFFIHTLRENKRYQVSTRFNTDILPFIFFIGSAVVMYAEVFLGYI